MNEVLATIARRFSCRHYKPDALSDELVKAIALAGAQAPSAKNRKPWSISVVRDRVLLKEMSEAALMGLKRREDPWDYNYIEKKGGDIFYGAPCVIVVATDVSNPYAKLDGGIAAENMVLAATSLGLGSVYCGFLKYAFLDEAAEEFRRKLEIPEEYEFCCAVVLGYPSSVRSAMPPGLDRIHYIDGQEENASEKD